MQKTNNVAGINYLNSTVNFRLLEQKAKEYALQQKTANETILSTDTKSEE